MPRLRGVGGKCVCGTRFYEPLGGDGYSVGVVFENNRLGRIGGRVCRQCSSRLNDLGPLWTQDGHDYFMVRQERDEEEEVRCLRFLR